MGCPIVQTSMGLCRSCRGDPATPAAVRSDGPHADSAERPRLPIVLVARDLLDCRGRQWGRPVRLLWVLLPRTLQALAVGARERVTCRYELDCIAGPAFGGRSGQPMGDVAPEEVRALGMRGSLWIRRRPSDPQSRPRARLKRPVYSPLLKRFGIKPSGSPIGSRTTRARCPRRKTWSVRSEHRH